VLGTDFAGTVESVGKDVTRFRPGDEVFGGEHGAFAEYFSISETGALAPAPSAGI
jgi:NADPH:quinone reductase-like Zn-dependent oxidoreductase